LVPVTAEPTSFPPDGKLTATREAAEPFGYVTEAVIAVDAPRAIDVGAAERDSFAVGDAAEA